MGLKVYYKRFFDRFKSLEDLEKVIGIGTSDMNFTYNPNIINYTPKEQVCCQIVSKVSATSNKYTSNYIILYKIAENKLKSII